MTRRKYEINASERFYKQQYCGCTYSLRDSNAYRQEQGQPKIKVGGDYHYADAESDCQEVRAVQ